MTISKEDFVAWRRSPVTVEIFKGLQDLVDNLNEALQSDAILLGEEQPRALLVGQRTGVEQVLNISIDEIGEDNDDEY